VNDPGALIAAVLSFSADHLHALNPPIPGPRIQQLIDQATQETANQSIEAIVPGGVQASTSWGRSATALPTLRGIGAEKSFWGDLLLFYKKNLALTQEFISPAST
jgi:hypothetical protein